MRQGGREKGRLRLGFRIQVGGLLHSGWQGAGEKGRLRLGFSVEGWGRMAGSSE